MKNKIQSEFIQFDILLDAANSKNTTGGRFFACLPAERRQVSFFFCQKNEQKRERKCRFFGKIYMNKFDCFFR